MEIRRITKQKQPLDEFYAHFAALGQANRYSKIGMRMLDLLRHLRGAEGPSVWGVTSHETLCLVPGDDYQLPILVSIRCDGDWFHVGYRLPPTKAPWPGAYVTGRTRDVEQVGHMIVFGLHDALQATDLDRRRF